MQLTIDVKDSVVDKIMYFLNNLKDDIKIINQKHYTQELDIKPLSKYDSDYKHIIKGRENRIKNPDEYVGLNEVDWD